MSEIPPLTTPEILTDDEGLEVASANNLPANDDLLTQVSQLQIRFIDLQFIDIFGTLKSLTVMAGQLPEILENGCWFDGSAIEGSARVAENDMYLVPDPTTFAPIPWTLNTSTATARFICWVYTPRGERFAGDPRFALDRVLKEAASLGYRYNTGPELEFFLFKDNANLGNLRAVENDRASYFDHSTDSASEVKRLAAKTLEAMNVEFESFHHEIAPGQHELDLTVTDALRCADNVVTTKYVLKALASQHGLRAIFMPKPLQSAPGSGMHTHQSLNYMDEPHKNGSKNASPKIIGSALGENVFAGYQEHYGLSEVARHFIAGQLYHAKAMSVILAPLVNSYKRLVAGYEAPVYITWARVNRGALVRIPHSGPGPGHRFAARLELRCPDSACNPYLAYAVMLKAGLDGVRRRLPLPEPIEENMFHFDATELRRRNIEMLPATMGEALVELQNDEVIQEALGEHIYENFMEAKLEEWKEYRRQVSPWEVERYLDA
jgi:glutamine synthetase